MLLLVLKRRQPGGVVVEAVLGFAGLPALLISFVHAVAGLLVRVANAKQAGSDRC